MRLVEAPDLHFLRRPSEAQPWRVLVSACLLGRPVGVNGTDYGLGKVLADFFAHRLIHAVGFCPEAYALGIPRFTPDIHGGDGVAVLQGRAYVRDEHGTDITREMLDGAQAMVALAREERVDLAILTDVSGACGTQVIYDGSRFAEPKKYQRGTGVAAAALLSAGVHVVSQRDDRTLGRLWAILDPNAPPTGDGLDHHEREWYRSYFASGGTT